MYSKLMKTAMPHIGNLSTCAFADFANSHLSEQNIASAVGQRSRNGSREGESERTDFAPVPAAKHASREMRNETTNTVHAHELDDRPGPQSIPRRWLPWALHSGQNEAWSSDAVSASKTANVGAKSGSSDPALTKEIMELREQNAQLKQSLADSESALRIHTSRNVTLTNDLRQKMDELRDKECELQALQQRTPLRHQSHPLQEQHLPVAQRLPGAHSFRSKNRPSETQSLFTPNRRGDRSLVSPSPDWSKTQMDNDMKSVEVEVHDSVYRRTELGPEQTRLDLLDVALLAQQPHQKSNGKLTDVPIGKRVFVSVNPLEAYNKSGAEEMRRGAQSFGAARPEERDTITSRPMEVPDIIKKGTDGPQVNHAACQPFALPKDRGQGTNSSEDRETLKSTTALPGSFERQLGLPRNPIPVMYNRRLAFRDDTRVRLDAIYKRREAKHWESL